LLLFSFQNINNSRDPCRQMDRYDAGLAMWSTLHRRFEKLLPNSQEMGKIIRMHSSQPDSRRVLTYGQDAVLLKTRRLLLEQGGFIADTANTSQEFEACISKAQSPYGLYVLCHTVPAAERHAIAADALKANIPVYQLTAAVTPPDFLIKVSELLSDL
jgi:hypothetical protein